MRKGTFAVLLAFCLASPLAAPAMAAGSGASDRLTRVLSGLMTAPPGAGPETGVLYDRVLPFSVIERYDGSPGAPGASWHDWRQMYDEIRRAGAASFPSLESLAERARRAGGENVVPVAILRARYDRLRPDALASGAVQMRAGRLVPGAGDPYLEGRVVAASALRPETHQGERVRFRFDPEDEFTNEEAALAGLEVDFDDGLGAVSVAPGAVHEVRYATAGEKVLRLRLRLKDGSTAHAAARFRVAALRTPVPHDTLAVTATIPYAGTYGTGRAYVYLADGHDAIVEPVVVIEGFDLDNSMGWNELYELLNREQLLETLRAQGFDAVVLDFTDAVDYIQRNAFVAVELISRVQAELPPGGTMVVAGASMGGLVGRYALSYMETHGIPHATRTFLSFDSPQGGANVPLGIQYWLWFFQDDSEAAAALLAALDTPGARQMLAYHHTDPPSGTGQADPLRAQLLADFAAVGDWPAQPRKAAIANGSGLRQGQGFLAGDQIIRWEYYSFLVDVVGNVWSVPDGGSREIFHGLIDIILLPEDEASVSVAGTRPFDNAPGGWRDSMAEMDATEAPYGDIVALHPNHCFIPAVSALALDTDDLFHDIAGDPDLLARTPFDAVYFPSAPPNQEHVEITAENAAWFLAEVTAGANSVDGGGPAEPAGAAGRAAIDEVAPNPAAEGTRIRFTVPRAGRARLCLYDAAGRHVAVLADGEYAPGARELRWDARGAAGGPLPLAPGVYFLSLQGEGFSASRKVLIP